MLIFVRKFLFVNVFSNAIRDLGLAKTCIFHESVVFFILFRAPKGTPRTFKKGMKNVDSRTKNAVFQ